MPLEQEQAQFLVVGIDSLLQRLGHRGAIRLQLHLLAQLFGLNLLLDALLHDDGIELGIALCGGDRRQRSEGEANGNGKTVHHVSRPASGSRSSTCVPSPGALVMETLPFARSAARLAIESPRPDPSVRDALLPR